MVHHEQLDQKLHVDPCSHLHHFFEAFLLIDHLFDYQKNFQHFRIRAPRSKKRACTWRGWSDFASVRPSLKMGKFTNPFFLESRPFEEVFGGLEGLGISCSWLFFSNNMCRPFYCFTYFQWSGSDPFPSIRYRRGTHTAQCETGEAQQLRSHDNLAECSAHHKINDMKEVLMWNTVF